MMKRKISIWLKKGTVFVLFLTSIDSFLGHKFIGKGDCAIIYFYIPLSLKDYFTMASIACAAIGLSYFLNRRDFSKRLLITEVVIYAIIVVLLCVYGNDILASVEFEWPHTYHPTPYTK